MADKSPEQGSANLHPHSDSSLSTRAEPAAKSTPHEHAVLIGSYKSRRTQAGTLVASVNGQAPADGEYSWQHAAAAALHGWAEHEHHAGEALKLSAEDYKKALLAASEPVTRIVGKDGKPGDKTNSEDAANRGIQTVTDYEPHAAAVSPHSPHQRKG